jgi:hypothetical protein
LHLHLPGTTQYGFTIGMASSLHTQHVHEERKDVVIRCLALGEPQRAVFVCYSIVLLHILDSEGAS